jgi:ABC-2 type transport system ATP-binding protein
MEGKRMSHREPILKIENFTYSYKSHWTNEKFLAVEDLSLEIYPGEAFGFLGHNGAGKTTTIKAILGLTRPTAGTITMFGKDHREPSARAEIGYLPEQPYFYDHLTVTELVTMYGKLAGIPNNKLKGAVQRALERVHVAHKAKARMRSLSKGLTQRAAMAQAIVAEPKLLILDEPFSGLDPLGRKEFKDLLFELKEGGTTIFASSHILEDIEFLCDRASIMAQGKLKLVLDLKDLEDHVERHYELLLETPLPAEFSPTSLGGTVHDQGSCMQLVFSERESAERALIQALETKATISEYRAAHGTLEELFVKLVQLDEAT